jgi:hypothetical protein
MTASKTAQSEQRRTAQTYVGFAYAVHFQSHARGSLAHWLCISKRLTCTQSAGRMWELAFVRSFFLGLDALIKTTRKYLNSGVGGAQSSQNNSLSKVPSSGGAQDFLK